MTTAYFTSAAPHTEHFLITKTPSGERAQPISLEYLNEGNANIIYRIKSLEQDTHLADPLRGKLLRLRKEKSFIRPTEEQYAAYTRHFVPLFQADDLIEQNLVRIDESITSSLNDSLSRLEKRGKRSASRLGDVLATREEYGLLMTDMTAQSGEVQFELKPKWLVQSPDAPSGAVRCRTCALRARRNAARSTYDSASDATLFCPLGLVSSDLAERRRVFEAIAHKQRWLPQSSGKFMTTRCSFVFTSELYGFLLSPSLRCCKTTMRAILWYRLHLSNRSLHESH